MVDNEIKLFITGRHIEINDHIREYVEEKIHKITKFLGRISEAHIVLSQEKYRYQAEITIVAPNGMSINASGETGDIFFSIDTAVDSLKRQVKKTKGKKYGSKRHRGAETLKEFTPVLDEDMNPPETEFEPKIIRTKEFAAKPISIEEAAMQLKEGNNNFLVFMNFHTNIVNVIYRRHDGNIGLIEPEFGS